MKIKKSKLKKVIYEEVSRLLSESSQELDTERESRRRREFERLKGVENWRHKYASEIRKARNILVDIYDGGDRVDREAVGRHLRDITAISPDALHDALEELNSEWLRQVDTDEGLTGGLIDFRYYTVMDDFWEYVRGLTGDHSLGPEWWTPRDNSED